MPKPACYEAYENKIEEQKDFIATIRHYINESLVGAERAAMSPIDAAHPDRKRIKYSEIAADDAQRLAFSRSIANRMVEHAKTEFPGAHWDDQNAFIAMNGLYGNGGAEGISTMVDAMVQNSGAEFSFTNFYEGLKRPAVAQGQNGQPVVVKPGLDYVHRAILGEAQSVFTVDPAAGVDNIQDLIDWINEEMRFNAPDDIKRANMPDISTALKLVDGMEEPRDFFAPYR